MTEGTQDTPDLVEIVHRALGESLADMRTEDRKEERELMRNSAHLDMIAIPCGVLIMILLAFIHASGFCEAATFTPAGLVAILRHLGRRV